MNVELVLAVVLIDNERTEREATDERRSLLIYINRLDFSSSLTLATGSCCHSRHVALMLFKGQKLKIQLFITLIRLNENCFVWRASTLRAENSIADS